MADSTTELRLFVENTGSLYPRVRAAVKKLAEQNDLNPAGTNLMPFVLKEWIEIVRDGAQMYQKEIVRRNFSDRVQESVAKEWATDYLKRIRSGEEGLYDK